MTALTNTIKSTLEDFSFKRKFIRRKVSVQDLYYHVYAWHPIPWKLPSIPPLSWLLEEVLSHHVVYDVGANRGYLALALLAKFPTLRLIAFEPNPVI